MYTDIVPQETVLIIKIEVCISTYSMFSFVEVEGKIIDWDTIFICLDLHKISGGRMHKNIPQEGNKMDGIFKKFYAM